MTTLISRNRTHLEPLIRPSVALGSLGAALVLLLPASALGAAGAATASASSATGARSYPNQYTLTDAKIGHWAVVLGTTPVHRLPTGSSSIVTKLDPVTGDGTQNVVLILAGIDISPTQTWYEVRLPILPNNSVGWVPRSALGTVNAVYTHLYVNRETFTATLKRDGHTIFTTRVGVGHSYWPTPAGQFYIRDELTNFNNPFYGPLAFGTSARSAVLTDWPGGGFVGVHGTNEPGILPGAVSHGCIRLVNDAIIRLSKLMTVGTPLTVT
jgi:lipoprotein-anchoring transpeptidase ErfK/SrfK